MSIYQYFLRKLTNSPSRLPQQPASTDQLRPIDELLFKAVHDQQYAPDFFRSLLNLNLVSIARNVDLELVQYLDAGEQSFIPVFSNRDYVPEQDLTVDLQMIEMTGREILGLTRGKCRVVLNPGRSYSRVFSIEDIETILDRLTKKAAPEFLVPVSSMNH